MRSVSQLGVCSLSGGVAIVWSSRSRRLGLGWLSGLSVDAGLLLGFGRRVERGDRYKSVPLVLLIGRIGLLCLQVQPKKGTD